MTAIAPETSQLFATGLDSFAAINGARVDEGTTLAETEHGWLVEPASPRAMRTGTGPVFYPRTHWRRRPA